MLEFFCKYWSFLRTEARNVIKKRLQDRCFPVSIVNSLTHSAGEYFEELAFKGGRERGFGRLCLGG